MEGSGIDLFWLQDLSKSVTDNMVNFTEVFQEIIEVISHQSTQSRVGLGSFVDKPTYDFGEVDDYCYKNHFPLSVFEMKGSDIELTSADNEPVDFASILNNLYTSSGKDWAEDQLEAIIHTALGNSSGFNDGKFQDNIKTILLATDSGYHTYNDDQGEANLKREVDHVSVYKEDPKNWCLDKAYPALSDVHDVLVKTNMNLIIVTTEVLVPYYQAMIRGVGEDRGWVVSLSGGYKSLAKALEVALTNMKLIKEQGLEEKKFAEVAAENYQILLAHENEMIKNEARREYRSRSGPNGTGQAPSNEIEIEMVVMQQVSAEFGELKTPIANGLNDALSALKIQFPKTKVALGGYSDKPKAPFGYGRASANDYCANMMTSLSPSIIEFNKAFEALIIRGGGDNKDSQLHALMHPFISSKTEWEENIVTAHQTMRLVTLITDSGYHVAGDAKEEGLILTPYSHFEVDFPPYYSCKSMDYPSIEDVRNIYIEQNAHPVILTTEKYSEVYKDLLEKLGLEGYVGVIDFSESVSNEKTIAHEMRTAVNILRSVGSITAEDVQEL